MKKGISAQTAAERVKEKMTKKVIAVTLFAAVLIGSTNVFAVPAGAISTDRFGYTGTVVRYDTLADAQAGVNAVDTVAIGNRDLALYLVNDHASYDANFNVIMGSWWYSTAGSAGWGNTTGNTGVGFMQLYDDDGSTETSIDMEFANFDGTYWSEFNFSVSGGNTTVDDFGRFSAYDNVNDGGIWHTYDLALTAFGLEGVDVAGNGTIEANNHPTNVDGSFSGLFQLTENQTSPDNQGFYTVDVTLDMNNWAWDNQADLDPYSFSDSYFVAIPEPASAGLIALVSGCAVFIRRRFMI